MQRYSFIIFIIIIFLRCDNELVEPKYEEQIVINALLYVGEGIKSVKITRTFKIDQAYDSNLAAVTNADVYVKTANKIYKLFEYINNPGVYFLPKDSLIITTGKKYELYTEINNKVIRATTIAPGKIFITDINKYSSDYLGDQFIIKWTKAGFTKGFIIEAMAKSTKELVDLGIITERRLKHFESDTLRAFPSAQSFPISEFEDEFQIPWFLFWYYGDFMVKLYAADKNIFDISTSTVIYQPQSSEFEQPNYHVENGLGFFAAVSVDSIKVHVKPRIIY